MADQHRINDKIVSASVVLIDENGKHLGEFSTVNALKIADEHNLDLVEVNPNGKPPICKLMDYGKFKYQLSKRLHDAKKKQKQIVVKEIKLRPKIEEHDFDFKLKHALDFLAEGNKVKVTVQFRGREASHSEFGMAVLNRFLEKVSEEAVPENSPQKLPRSIFVILAPKKQ